MNRWVRFGWCVNEGGFRDSVDEGEGENSEYYVIENTLICTVYRSQLFSLLLLLLLCI